MKDTDILRKRQIITGRVAEPPVVLENNSLGNGLTRVQQGDAFERARKKTAAKILFFADCDAGGELSVHKKIVIHSIMVDILNYLKQSHTACIIAKRSTNLKDSLRLKNILINTGMFKDIHSIGAFLGRTDTFFTFLNAPTIWNSHSCVDNIRYKALHDYRYNPSCRCINLSGIKIFVGEEMFNPALNRSTQIYALYRKISHAYFSFSASATNHSHVIFKNVLEYATGETIVEYDSKQRVTENQSNLKRYKTMVRDDMMSEGLF